jgi:hypothetical protein
VRVWSLERRDALKAHDVFAVPVRTPFNTKPVNYVCPAGRRVYTNGIPAIVRGVGVPVSREPGMQRPSVCTTREALPQPQHHHASSRKIKTDVCAVELNHRCRDHLLSGSVGIKSAR